MPHRKAIGALRPGPRDARALAVTALLASATLTIPFSSPVSAAWSPLARTAASVRVGNLLRLPEGSRAVGAVAPASRLTVQFVLAPRDPSKLAASLAFVERPTSPEYRHYLSRGEFAEEFGASGTTLDRLEQGLRSIGLAGAAPAADRLSVSVTASAAQLDHALHVNLLDYESSTGARFVREDRVPTLPSAIGDEVSSIIGLDTSAQLAPVGLVRELARAHEQVTTKAARGAVTATTACATLIAESGAGYTPDQIAAAYGMDGLYSEGDLGAGTSIGVIEFSSYSSSDITTYANCFGVTPSITVVPVSGGPTGSGGSSQVEAELDLEDLIGLVPDSPLVVYEGPSSDGDVSNAQAYSTYATAVEDDAVKIITTSWGGCEGSIDAGTLRSENTIFEQAALQGQTIIAASGDSGSEDCDGELNGSAGQALAVDDPASQPFVTGVGGTTLTVAPARTEVVWNTGDTNDDAGAGGGGVSSVWAMPRYQKRTPGSLGVRSAAGSSGACAISGGCREVPDVSDDAGNPYAIFCSSGSQLCGRSGWTPLGGTSAAAPTFAAIVALADSSSACGTTFATSTPSLGFVNPGLYAIASTSAYSSSFTDITSGSNDLLDAHNNEWTATTGYDLASGLGSPIADNGAGGGLVAELCSPATISAASTKTGLVAPKITGLAPISGRSTGRIRVVLSGKGFLVATSVDFGSTPALSFRVVSATKIVAVAPAGLGRVHVGVTSRAGATKNVRAGVFSYLIAPAVTALSPDSAPSSGHRTVVILGSGFQSVRSITFGGTPVLHYSVRSRGRIVVTVPRGRGTVRVVVTTKAGRSPKVAASQFSYA